MAHRGFFFFLLVALSAVLSVSAWGGSPPPEGKTFGQVMIRHFAAGKKVIPAVVEIVDWRIVDIKLPDVVVENQGRKAVTLLGIDVLAKDGEALIASTRVQPAELSTTIRKSAATFRKPSSMDALRIAYGDIVIPPGTLAASRKINPGESAILPLSRMAFLHYVGHARIEAMELAVRIWSGGKAKTLTYPVKLTQHESKARYRFPLHGDLHLAFLPLSYVHHRAAQSQEFAFDVVAAAQKGADFTEISTPAPKKLSDYGIWGREVLAVGDGIVADMGDRFPEAAMSDPAAFSDPGYTQKLLRDLIGKIGFTNAVAGNYIVIDHGNGEFSVYCHLKEGSILVRKGDQVKKGKVIAQVGNTGNSSAPHLHFQMMDSADFRTANGLPVIFDDMPASAMLIEYPIKANTLVFSDSLFDTVK